MSADEFAEKEREVAELHDLWDEYGAEWGDRLSEASAELEALRPAFVCDVDENGGQG